jgi:hypothetical protein
VGLAVALLLNPARGGVEIWSMSHMLKDPNRFNFRAGVWLFLSRKNLFRLRATGEWI